MKSKNTVFVSMALLISACGRTSETGSIKEIILVKTAPVETDPKIPTKCRDGSFSTPFSLTSTQVVLNGKDLQLENSEQTVPSVSSQDNLRLDVCIDENGSGYLRRIVVRQPEMLGAESETVVLVDDKLPSNVFIVSGLGTHSVIPTSDTSSSGLDELIFGGSGPVDISVTVNPISGLRLRLKSIVKNETNILTFKTERLNKKTNVVEFESFMEPFYGKVSQFDAFAINSECGSGKMLTSESYELGTTSLSFKSCVIDIGGGTMEVDRLEMTLTDSDPKLAVNGKPMSEKIKVTDLPKGALTSVREHHNLCDSLTLNYKTISATVILGHGSLLCLSEKKQTSYKGLSINWPESLPYQRSVANEVPTFGATSGKNSFLRHRKGI